MAKYVIGIDLGTTKSVVSVYEDGKPKIIENLSGDRITPSYVALKKNKDKKTGQVTTEWIVGKNAKNQMVMNPVNTLFGVKRLIGRRFDDVNVKKMQGLAPYKIVAGPNGDAWVEIEGKAMAPAEVSAMVLRELKAAVEKYLGKDAEGNQIEVKDAVITCPAYFNDSQIKATENAGQLAGLNVLRIVKEPTAAALAYGREKQREGKVIVYDLGGGTFDVSVLDVQIAGDSMVVEVKAVDGDTFLGGENFDERIQARLFDLVKEESGLDLRAPGASPRGKQAIRDAAEKLKIELSSQTSAEINIPFLGDVDGEPVSFEYKMTRTELEGLVKDLIEATRAPCERALKNAGITMSEIDEVLLVGAQTRMPKVAEFVKNLFGKEPRQDLSVQEIVAMGAAVQGAILTGHVENVILLDVIPLTLGLRVSTGDMAPVVPRNSTIPCTMTQEFFTKDAGQPNVIVRIYQGERPKADDNKWLGEFTVSLPPGTPKGTKIEIVFNVDENAALNVEAKVAGRTAKAKVKANGGLSEAEIEKMLKDAEANAEADRLYKETQDAIANADVAINRVDEDMAADWFAAGSDDLKSAFNDAVTGLKDAFTQKNVAGMQQKMTELEDVRSKLGQAFVAAQTAQSEEAPAPEATTDAPKGPTGPAA